MHRNESFYWSASSPHWFVHAMNYSCIGTPRISFIVWTNQLLSLLIHYSEPVEWLFLTRHRETLVVQMHTFHQGLLCNTCPDMYWLPYRWMVSRCVLNIAEFLCTRACIPNNHFSFIQDTFLFSSLFFHKKTITISFSLSRGCFENLEDQGDLLVMTVVQYPQHVQ